MPHKIKTHTQLQHAKNEPERQQALNASRPADVLFYSKAVWLKLSAYVRARDPICKVCNREVSTETDHIVDRLDRPDLALDPENLQGICARCHSAKTMKRNRAKYSGMGKDIQVRGPIGS